jgi:bifunctional DNA-binding transcriptional regulator/antitoxin component of YhaV-PrlF toxin-antitoxin module
MLNDTSMSFDYQKIWSTMNSLESVTSKICSAREILDSAINALENRKLKKTESLLYAVDEYLQYYLQEFDTKFKDAWKETVNKVKEQEIIGAQGFQDDCMPPWGHSDLEYLSKLPPEEPKQDKVVKWQLPVEEVENGDTGETEYFITFPDDLLEATNLKPGDEVEWVDRGDGSFLLRKTWNDPYKDEMIAAGYKMVDGVWTMEKKPLNHDEMVAAGYTMTADGFWIKE